MVYLDKKTAIHCSPRVVVARNNVEKPAAAAAPPTAAALQLQVNGVSFSRIGLKRSKNENNRHTTPAEGNGHEPLRGGEASLCTFASPFSSSSAQSPRQGNAGKHKSAHVGGEDRCKAGLVLEKRYQGHPSTAVAVEGIASHAKGKKAFQSKTSRGEDGGSAYSRHKPNPSEEWNTFSARHQPFLDPKSNISRVSMATSESYPLGILSHHESHGLHAAKKEKNHGSGSRACSAPRQRYVYQYSGVNPRYSGSHARSARSLGRPPNAFFDENVYAGQNSSRLRDSAIPIAETSRDASPAFSANRGPIESEEKLASKHSGTANVRLLGPLSSQSRSELLLRRAEAFSVAKYSQMANNIQNRRPLHELPAKVSQGEPPIATPLVGKGGGGGKSLFCFPPKDDESLASAVLQSAAERSEVASRSTEITTGDAAMSPKSETKPPPPQQGTVHKGIDEELRLIRDLCAAADVKGVGREDARGALSGCFEPLGSVVLSQPKGLKYPNTWVLCSSPRNGGAAGPHKSSGDVDAATEEVDYHNCFRIFPQAAQCMGGLGCTSEAKIAGALEVKQQPVYSLTANSVLLQNKLGLLECEHFSKEIAATADGAREKLSNEPHVVVDAQKLLVQGADPNQSKSGDGAEQENEDTSIFMHPPPRREHFVELSYAAQTLLSVILYLRALGGLPLLLRAGPLTKGSPVVGKEHCLELVFRSPPKPAGKGPESTDAASTPPAGAQPPKPSALLSRLSRTLSSVSGPMSVEGTLTPPKPLSQTLTPKPQGEAEPTAQQSPRTWLSKPSFRSPSMLLGLSGNASFSSKPTHPIAEARPIAREMGGDGVESLIDPDDELCLVLRAVLAPRRRVSCFGQDETVFVLPPLLPEEDVSTPEEEKSALGRLLGDSAKPLHRFLLSKTERKRVEERRRANQSQLNRGLAVARNGLRMNEDGSPSAEDFGDLVVALLPSKEVSELGGEPPSAMELESCWYRIFDLKDYQAQDPKGINRTTETPSAGIWNEPAGKMTGSTWGPSAMPMPSWERLDSNRGNFSFIGSPGSTQSVRPSPFKGGASRLESPKLLSSERQGQRAAPLKEKPKPEGSFPLYRAVTVSETTLREYHDSVSRIWYSSKQRPNSLSLPTRSRSTQEASSLISRGSISARAADPEHQKMRQSHEIERDFFHFRPFNLNSFYDELQEALQRTMDTQVRLAKGKVVNVCHM